LRFNLVIPLFASILLFGTLAAGLQNSYAGELGADIHVLKFNDINANGVQDDGEDGILEWLITVHCDDPLFNEFDHTNGNGQVWFEGIPARTQCTVAEEQKDGWAPTTPSSVMVNLVPGESRDVVFGNIFILEVNIDIKPGSDPNSVKPKDRGLVPVAILGSETFDVQDINVSTVLFGPGGAMAVHMEIEDVNDDGLEDIVLQFPKKDTGIKKGDDMACITGETIDGLPFEGCDAVKTKSNKNKP